MTTEQFVNENFSMLSEEGSSLVVAVEELGMLIALDIFIEVFVLFSIELSTYLSATEEDLHPPCFFSSKRSPPASTKMVAEDLLKQ